MTAEDRLRDRLRDAAATMPVGSGSLTGVQVRAAQLQRRRNAVRGGAGAFALAAVALVGFASLRGTGIDDFSTTVEGETQSDAAGMPATTETSALAIAADEEMADEADEAMDDGAAFESVEAASVSEEAAEEEMGGAASEDSLALGQEALDDSEQQEDEPPLRDDSQGASFATAVSIVKPPPEVEGVAMSYSFSGGHAVARADDNWYAYDGSEWQSVGMPDDIEVVAVDLSGPGRLAILGVVRPLACVIEHIVGVQTADGWSFARIDDETPPIVDSELVHARVRITDRAVEVERTERLRLNDDCADAPGSSELTPEAAELVAELADLDEVQRQSWLVASFEPDFGTHWPSVASDDAHGAVAQRSDLSWAPVSNPLYTVAARELAPARSPEDEALSVELHRTTMLDVDTTVEVSAGMAMLKHGDQSWEVCPIPDVEQANGEVGWAGEHLAVVVGKPEQTLFVIQRAE
ncbi:MAG: hypothetical protein OXB99_13955 [Acidimicrobiaceae bacterium]|nr:hypothetical protein [Acidimicrobiaceae bacterium]